MIMLFIYINIYIIDYVRKKTEAVTDCALCGKIDTFKKISLSRDYI